VVDFADLRLFRERLTHGGHMPLLCKLLMWAFCSSFFLTRAIAGEEHYHPSEHAELHDKFYSTWLIPNGGSERKNSCCNLVDCAPATVKKEGGTWFVWKPIAHRWVVIPDRLLEHNQPDPRQSPDGRSHVCMAKVPHDFRVFCAVLGSGQ
jgi:hypothetical protein